MGTEEHRPRPDGGDVPPHQRLTWVIGGARVSAGVGSTASSNDVGAIEQRRASHLRRIMQDYRKSPEPASRH
jgi:hypothetical protein